MPRRATTHSYPIRAVAQITGLSADTLRAWERRYAAVVPQRSDRGRVYSDADIARLKQLALLVERGHAIGTVAGLSTTDLTRLLDGSRSTVASGPDDVVADLTPLVRALDRYDLAAIEATLSRHAAVLTPRALIFAVILPLMAEVGRRWESRKLRPSQEHFVSALVRSLLGSLLRSLRHPDGRSRIVFATLAGERHELGLLAAAVLAASSGWGVLYLGPDLPAADVAHAVETSGAAAVVLSATSAGRVAKAEARALADRLQSVPIGIGGPGGQALVDAAGGRARYLPSLDDVERMLTQSVSHQSG